LDRLRIDPYTAIPKYQQLFAILRKKIEDGEWAPRQPIPSERDLETLYKASRTTVRQALAKLETHNYIYREHGRGTFVAPQKFQNSLHVLTSFTADMRERGLVPGQQILEMGWVEASQKLRQQLELPAEDDQVFRLKRLRLADGQPIGIHNSYLPLALGQLLTAAEIEASGSLYRVLEEQFHLYPTEADETLESTIADVYEAQLLDIAAGSPLLLIERTVWSQTRQAMEFVKMLYRGDRYKYFVHLSHG
jgi:GntR family transcriptional regulator